MFESQDIFSNLSIIVFYIQRNKLLIKLGVFKIKLMHIKFRSKWHNGCMKSYEVLQDRLLTSQFPSNSLFILLSYFLLIFYLPWFTLPNFPSIRLQAFLPFLSCCIWTITITKSATWSINHKKKQSNHKNDHKTIINTISISTNECIDDIILQYIKDDIIL